MSWWGKAVPRRTQISFNQYQTKATAKYQEMGSSVLAMNPNPLLPGTSIHQDPHASPAHGQHSFWCQEPAQPQEEEDAALSEQEFKHPHLPEGWKLPKGLSCRVCSHQAEVRALCDDRGSLSKQRGATLLSHD